MHLPDMITDLAVMLLTAAAITILFKRIKQPLILGYILAGFLISPYFPMFFTVADMGSINLWSEIGVIILMFHIGLEFNLHKLAKMGATAILSAIVKMAGVLLTGILLGAVLGFSSMNSIFLGVMLSISSTAVIQKSFEELGVKNEKYAQLVMGTLIIEDIVAIFMMVVLSTISVSQNVSGSELLGSLGMMICYLIVWLILGISLLPVLLNKVRGLVNDEMLLILSLGLCFGMVLIANMLGFSAELGAFMAGSLLAGTVHAERVEHLSKGIKDMFVSIFFLSVGMRVDPNAIVTYAGTILLIVIAAIISKLVFATIGMLLSGQTPDTAVKSGFSLAPIGEFSFIIASLGISLGVMNENLYPIIVSAAVITTFLTPFLIKRSKSCINCLHRIMPESVLELIRKYTSSAQADDDKDTDWNIYIKSFLSRTLIYGVLMLVTAVAGIRLLEPLLTGFTTEFTGKLATCIAIYFIIGMFTRPMLNPHNNTFTSLWLKSKANHLPLLALTAIKFIIIITIAMIPLNRFFGLHPLLICIPVGIGAFFMAKSNFMYTPYLQLETRFLRNLYERVIEKSEEENGTQQAWLDEELYIISLIAPENADFLGKSLKHLQWGKLYNVFVVKIRHKGRQTILPGPKATIHAGDKIFVVGDVKAIENFYTLVKLEPARQPRTLKEFMNSGYPDPQNALAICAIKVNGSENYANKPLISGQIRDKWHCVILGLQQNGYPIIMPDVNTIIRKDDLVWVMGSNANVGALLAESNPEETLKQLEESM